MIADYSSWNRNWEKTETIWKVILLLIDKRGGRYRCLRFSSIFSDRFLSPFRTYTNTPIGIHERRSRKGPWLATWFARIVALTIIPMPVNFQSLRKLRASPTLNPRVPTTDNFLLDRPMIPGPRSNREESGRPHEISWDSGTNCLLLIPLRRFL